ncbi:MAG: DUF4302 domain-containing protein [Cyclobacteriaceae bacterium]
MKRIFGVVLLVGVLLACREDEPIFSKSADERAQEAITDLNSRLVAPSEGWLLRYRPENESGTYNVLLNFQEDGEVNIQTDFGVNDGEFYDQTITYRVDNSLGLELILENYSFFSFLFEQEDATFLAEYEFDYVNETPDGDLVFRSKTDPSSPTNLVFQLASADDINLLGRELSTDLSTFLDRQNVPTLFASTYRLDYQNQDLTFYLNFDDFRRTISFNFVSPDGSSGGREINFTSPYIIQGNEIVLDNPLSGSYYGQQVELSSIRFGSLSDITLTTCDSAFTAKQYSASINTAPAVLENTLFAPNGANVLEQVDFYFCLNNNIFQSGRSIGGQVDTDVEGSLAMLLYYDESVNDPFYALGFFIVNESGTITRVLREFTPTVDGNQLQLAYDTDFTLLQDTTGVYNGENIDKYLNMFAEGEGVYLYKIDDATYEMYNSCNETSFVFFHN